MSNQIFNKVPVDVPNKSGFDLSHSNFLTGGVGTLVPILVDPLLPNDTVSLGTLANIQLPPMATDFLGRVQYKIEAFFVPYRVLWGGWKSYLENFNNSVPGVPSSLSVPGATFSNPSSGSWSLADVNSVFGSGSLADYLGFKSGGSGVNPSNVTAVTLPNLLPFFAYHKIYDDWYRNSLIQRPVFLSNSPSVSSSSGWQNLFALPWRTSISDTVGSPAVFTGPTSQSGSTPAVFNDGVGLFALRQRNWAKDYFTNATPQPQSGTPTSLAFNVSGSSGSFTISGLRAANSIQQFKERNNIAGGRYNDIINVQYGIYPSDAITDRAVFLGRMSFDVYNKKVYQQSFASSNGNNPFDSVGAQYASPQAYGQDSLVGNFTASEHGFLFVMGSLVPDAQYSSGMRRYLIDTGSDLIAPPILSGVGDQPIYQSEVVGNIGSGSSEATFGYTQRFSQFKFMLDEVHGLLRDGQSLQSFALQRSLSQSGAVLGTQFIQIPTTYLDQVAAVDSAQTSNFGYWADFGFNYRKVSTLPAYSIPTLGDLKNTHTIMADKGGKML